MCKSKETKILRAISFVLFVYHATFRYLPEIQAISEDIVTDLEASLNNWEQFPGQIAEVFIRKGKVLMRVSRNRIWLTVLP